MQRGGAATKQNRHGFRWEWPANDANQDEWESTGYNAEYEKYPEVGNRRGT